MMMMMMVVILFLLLLSLLLLLLLLLNTAYSLMNCQDSFCLSLQLQVLHFQVLHLISISLGVVKLLYIITRYFYVPIYCFIEDQKVSVGIKKEP